MEFVGKAYNSPNGDVRSEAVSRWVSHAPTWFRWGAAAQACVSGSGRGAVTSLLASMPQVRVTKEAFDLVGPAIRLVGFRTLHAVQLPSIDRCAARPLPPSDHRSM
jgi:hypothetical protein